MCGITGICALGRSLQPAIIEAANRSLRHRGPDDEGYVVYDLEGGARGASGARGGPAHATAAHHHGNDSVVRDGPHIREATRALNRGAVLGSRRLSIIDPTPAGHQPMSYDDGRLWITFNGAIYNYKEIREELVARGRTFRTQTDTEVILAAYAEWGVRCVERFNGMWGLAILDLRTKTLFASRDRFGVKPFYYHRQPDLLLFASEIKGLLAFPFVERRIHTGRAYDYLMWGIIKASQETFFEGVSELPPGHSLTVDLESGRVTVARYYTLPFAREVGRFDRATLDGHVARVRELVKRSVRLRLRADVPIGSCLSGGVDSSSIVATIREILDDEEIPQVGELQRVFTACYDDPALDESRFAEAVVKMTGSQWFRTYPTANDLWSDLTNLVRAQDEPFGSTSIYAQYRVMRLARESGVTVALDGQGGDELFVGYDSQYPALFWDLVRGGRVGALAREWRGLANASFGRAALVRGMAEYLGAHVLPGAAMGAAARAFRGEGAHLRRDFVHEHEARNARIAERASLSLNELSHEMLTQFILPLLLRYEDRNAMAWSIESRTPFADDHPLIEYVNGVPAIYKVHDGWSKTLLREAMRTRLPESVYRRTDKIGFATPQRAWLRALREDALEALTQPDEFLETSKIGDELDAVLANGASRAVDNIWRLLIFKKWREVFEL
jgi:asparagine synthase (glutamine-hydrolysing)